MSAIITFGTLRGIASTGSGRITGKAEVLIEHPSGASSCKSVRTRKSVNAKSNENAIISKITYTAPSVPTEICKGSISPEVKT